MADQTGAPADRPIRRAAIIRDEERRRQLERRRLVGACLAVTVLAATLTVLLLGRAEAADAVVVVERGHSVATDAEGDDLLSFGVVVENRTDDVARLVLVRVEFESSSQEFTIDRLLPGQRVGLAGTGTCCRRGEPDGIDVSIDGPASRAEPVDTAAVEVDDLQLTHSPANHPIVSFTLMADPGHQGPDVRAYAIFRDADGAIIGGADDGPELTGLFPQPGHLEATARFPDLATAEVYAVEG